MAITAVRRCSSSGPRPVPFDVLPSFRPVPAGLCWVAQQRHVGTAGSMSPIGAAGTGGITAAVPQRVFLSHTSDLGRQTEPGSFVAAAVEAVLRARHAVTDMAYFAARDTSPAVGNASEWHSCRRPFGHSRRTRGAAHNTSRSLPTSHELGVR